MNWLKKIFRKVVKEELDQERAAEEAAQALRGDGDGGSDLYGGWMRNPPRPIVVVETPRCHTCGTEEKLTKFGGDGATHPLYFCRKCYR